jgi:hypothetical protein
MDAKVSYIQSRRYDDHIQDYSWIIRSSIPQPQRIES